MKTETAKPFKLIENLPDTVFAHRAMASYAGEAHPLTKKLTSAIEESINHNTVATLEPAESEMVFNALWNTLITADEHSLDLAHAQRKTGIELPYEPKPEWHKPEDGAHLLENPSSGSDPVFDTEFIPPAPSGPTSADATQLTDENFTRAA